MLGVRRGQGLRAVFGGRRILWPLVVAVGVIGGLTGAAYVETMKLFIHLLGPGNWSRPAHLVVLGLVGAAIGGMTFLLGNPGSVELLVNNIHLTGGPSDISELRSLIPISLIGIGAGSAIGPEAPLVQTTGSLGSFIAVRRRLSTSDARVLTITGMAAGFTVLFHAPLGSSIFALEILHRRGLEYYEALLPAAIGSLIGFTLYAGVTGASSAFKPIWRFPTPGALHPSDIALGLAAGIVGAVVATGFAFSHRLFHKAFHALPAVARPVAGGLALGGLAWLSPYALTFAEGQIQVVASAKLAVATLVLAAAVKFVASSMIVSSGWRGGFIIPLLFMGAALGAATAQTFDLSKVVAMVCFMAACNAGVTKTPFGSTLIVVEMSGVRLLPPVLVASIVALFLSTRVNVIETQRAREQASSEDGEGPPGPMGPSTPPLDEAT